MTHAWLTDVLENTDWLGNVIPAVNARDRRGVKNLLLLADGFVAEVRIPAGMTKAEADRICQMVKAGVMEEKTK